MALTAGAAPVHVWWGERGLEVAPPSIRPVDATGSGDVFAAACGFGLAAGWPPDQLIDFAAAAGAAAAALPRSGVPTLEAVMALQGR